tara:strand:- start:10580 stop:11596 length:1017 start_codon:yes stop_codon:yes gene_type:complete
MSTLGIVAIGRNEGERFKKCVESFSKVTQAFTFVYVDSGSTDGSVQVAKEAGVGVVELDTTVPFTAARARNAGVDYLSKHYPNLTYIQFVDGDCQIAPNWLTSAIEVLEKEQDVAVVCGRRKEINPQSSTYNALIDLEWNTPIGYNKACGGDALYRASAFLKEDGFNGTVIAGEEPELCYRLRQRAWKIKRIDADMTYHDAALTTFSQWWKRAERYGHAAFEGAYRYGKQAERYYVKEAKGIVLWGALVPFTFIASLFLFWPLAILTCVLLLLQWFKLKRFYSGANTPTELINQRAWLTLVCKIAEFKGGLRFLKNKILKRQNKLIEYKGSAVGEARK